MVVINHMQIDKSDPIVLHKLKGSHYDWLLQIGTNYIYLTDDKLKELGLSLNSNTNGHSDNGHA